MLSKLAAHAEQPTASVLRSRSDAELRDQVRRLISSWDLADPNPDDYTAALDSISRHTRTATPTTPLVLIRNACFNWPWRSRPSDQTSSRCSRRCSLARTSRRCSIWWKGRPRGSTRETLLDRIVTPDRLVDVLHAETPNTRLGERLALRLRLVAVDPIINLLEDEEERLHGWACDMLVRLADVSRPRVAERLTDAPVQAQRQLLHVIDRLGEWPQGFCPEQYLTSANAGVRREAMKLMLRRDDMRDAAIRLRARRSGRADGRYRVGRRAQAVPVEAVPILMRRIDNSTLSAELRARGIRALAASGSLDANAVDRAALDQEALAARHPVLREKSPQLISSIAGLAAHWSSAPEAAEVLALVAKSKDADLRTAASRTGAA